MKKIVLLFCSLWAASFIIAADITVTQTAEQLAGTYGWTAGGFYDSFQLDGIITFKANQPTTGNKNGYYSSDDPRDWRMYQARNNGEFTVTSRSGYRIRSLKFVYTNKNTGVLSLVADTCVDKQYQVASGQTLEVDTNAITFFAGNTTATTNGQVRLSQFTVTYYATDPGAVVERFSQVDQTKNNDEEVTWQGDYADWKVLNARRSAKDTLNGGAQGSWCKSGGYFKTTAQGGIKRLSFEWRQFVTDTVVDLMMALSAGEVWQDTARMQSVPVQAASKNYTYAKNIACKQDVALSLVNISSASATSKDRFLLGDIFITPYIYIAPENLLFHFERAKGSFDLSTILQDNTDGEGEVVYTIVKDETGGATIKGSVIDFSQVDVSGAIQVQVSWNDGKVKLTPVTLQIALPEAGDTYFLETFASCSKTKMSGTTYVVGDAGMFGWNMSHFTREASDTVMGIQGTSIDYNGGVTMNGVQEGGIKSITFAWRATDATMPVHFVVSVDGTAQDVKYTAAQSGGKTMTYVGTYNIDHNTAMSITLGAKESTAQSKIVLGSVAIAPYLLFRTKRDTIRLDEATSFYLDSALINNTKAQATYSILQDETGAATITDGVLDVSAATKNGKVQVQATWGQVTTTMSLYVQVAATGLVDAYTIHHTPYTKIIQNNQLIIIHNNQTYNAQGSRL